VEFNKINKAFNMPRTRILLKKTLSTATLLLVLPGTVSDYMYSGRKFFFGVKASF
jgi:hypothetical protein